MDEAPLIIVKRKDPRSDAVRFVAGMLLFALAFYLFVKGSLYPYPQLRWIGPGIFCLLGAAQVIYNYCYVAGNLYAYNDRLVIKSLFGLSKRTVYLKDITEWDFHDLTIPVKKGEPRWCQELILIMDKTVRKIQLTGYTNFNGIKDYLIKGKPRANTSKPSPLNYWGIAWILAFLVAFFSLCFPLSNTGKMIGLGNLTSFSAVITNDPFVQQHKALFTAHLEVQQYPGFDFCVHFNAEDKARQFDKDIKKGDTVSLNIITDVYLKKLTRSKSLSFWDKTLGYPDVSVYGIRHHNVEYAHLEGHVYYNPNPFNWFTN